MWIPRPLYEAKPYVSAGAGIACILAAFHVSWLPHGLLFAVGGGLVTLGLVLWMKRRDYRNTNSNYDPRSLDE
jgi:hypothetical protein